MARSSFLRGRGEEGDGVPPGTGGPLTAFIDQGSEFEGKLSFQDTVRIDGRFRGEIASENTLVVGEPGEIEATVRSRNVIISGRVVGDVFATDQLMLHRTARVEGDVQTAALVIDEGAVLNGRVTMKSDGAAVSPGAPLEVVRDEGSDAPQASDG